MADNKNQKSPPEGENYLREIRDAVVGIQDTLQKLQDSKTQQPETNKSGLHQHHLVHRLYGNDHIRSDHCPYPSRFYA